MGRSGLGRAVHVARCDAATSRPWALTGPWSMAAVYGGLSGASPWTTDWSMVDRVHPSPLRRGLGTPGALVGDQRGGGPLFLPWRCSCRRRACCEPPRWRWCPIGVGKSFPGPRRLRLRGQGGDQSSPRCWPWRAVARQGSPVVRSRMPALRWLVLGRWGFYGCPVGARRRRPGLKRGFGLLGGR